MKRLILFLIILIICPFTGRLYSQPVVGQSAPPLAGLKFLNNQLPVLGNKLVFIDFWATWCGPCRQSLPHLDILAGKYKDKITFLAVSDEKENVVTKALKQEHFKNLDFCLDIESGLFSKFEVKAIPRYFLISPQNIILASGYSSELTDHYFDSIVIQYQPSTKNDVSNIKISQDSLQKMFSIEINERPAAKKYLGQSGYTFVMRDSLNKVLPYLKGASMFHCVVNRMRFQNLPHKMIEVKTFSRNTPLDSLKMVIYNQTLASFGVSSKLIREQTLVYDFNVIDPLLLKDKNTVVEPGALHKMAMLNDSIMRFDNYTIKDVVGYLEGVYYPRIFYAQSTSTVEYDWDIPLVNPVKQAYITFDQLKETLKKKYGIEIKESKREEIFTVYN